MIDIRLNPEHSIGGELSSFPKEQELKSWMVSKNFSLSTPKIWTKYKSQYNIWNDHLKVHLPLIDEIAHNNKVIDIAMVNDHVVNPIYNTWGKLVKPESATMTLGERLNSWEADHESSNINCQVPLIMTLAWAIDNNLDHAVIMGPNYPHPYLIIGLNRSINTSKVKKCAQIDYSGKGSQCVPVDSIWDTTGNPKNLRESWMYSEGPVATMRLLDYLAIQSGLVYDRKKLDRLNVATLKHQLDQQFYKDFLTSDKSRLIGFWENQARMVELDDK